MRARSCRRRKQLGDEQKPIVATMLATLHSHGVTQDAIEDRSMHARCRRRLLRGSRRRGSHAGAASTTSKHTRLQSTCARSLWRAASGCGCPRAMAPTATGCWRRAQRSPGHTHSDDATTHLGFKECPLGFGECPLGFRAFPLGTVKMPNGLVCVAAAAEWDTSGSFCYDEWEPRPWRLGPRWERHWAWH